MSDLVVVALGVQVVIVAGLSAKHFSQFGKHPLGLERPVLQRNIRHAARPECTRELDHSRGQACRGYVEQAGARPGAVEPLPPFHAIERHVLGRQSCLELRQPHHLGRRIEGCDPVPGGGKGESVAARTAAGVQQIPSCRYSPFAMNRR